MKKLIIMLVLALGVISCDKESCSEEYKPSCEFESFIIGPSGNYVIVKDLLDADDSYGYYDKYIFVTIYNHLDVRYSISLKDNYGTIEVVNCSVNNEQLDYQSFKIKLLTSYNKN